jgi:hypothetical protein
VQTDLATILAEVNQTAAAWYNGVKFNAPVIAPSPSQLALAQSAASTQANFAAQNPFLAGLLLQPGLIFLIAAIIVIILLFR